MKVKNVLFDLDGTLMDTNRLIIESWKHAHRELHGIEKDEAEIIATFGEPLVDTIRNEFSDVDTEEAIRVYREYQAGIFLDMLTLFPGVDEMLLTLKAQGYRLGVVTSRKRDSSLIALRKYDLEKLFECVVTADDCDTHKPNPEPIEKALDFLNAKAEETVMVGDSIFDIGCAKNAGTKSIYVSWSVAQPDFKGDVKPDYIVHNAQEIIKVIEEC